MPNEETSQIVTVNSNLKSIFPRKTGEKVGGAAHPKLKETMLTYQTFCHNIKVSDDILNKVVTNLNTKLEAAMKDVVANEEKKAEEDLIKKMTPVTAEAKPVNENLEALKIVRRITNAAKKEKVDAIFLGNGINLTYPKKYEKNDKMVFSCDFENKPKALMIPAILQGICVEIEKNLPKYDSFDKDWQSIYNIGDNWQKVFEGIDIPVQEIKDEEYIDEKDHIDVIQNNKITPAELERRKLQANIGEELEDIRKILGGFGQSHPFKEGLLKREDNLRKMLQEVGMFTASQKIMKDYSNGKTTDIQKVIDQITGYKEPLSKEEHDKVESEINDYYQKPEVQDIIDNLRHKNILYDFNKEEAHEKIIQAERIDNEKRRERINSLENEQIRNQSAIKFLEEPNEYEDKKDIIDENYLLNGAKEQSRLLIAEGESVRAMKEAKMRSEKQEILNLADRYARDIDNFNKVIDLAHKCARELFSREMVKGQAEKYAKNLFEFNKTIDLAHTYANDIFEKDMLKTNAEEYAKKILEINKTMDLARQYAKDIFAQNEKIDIINGADEQAKLLLLNMLTEATNIVNASAERRRQEVRTLNDIGLSTRKIESEAKPKIVENPAPAAKTLVAEPSPVKPVPVQAKPVTVSAPVEQSIKNENKINEIKTHDVEIKEPIKQPNRQKEIEEAKGIVDALLKSTNVRVRTSEDVIDMRKSSNEQARMLKENNQKIAIKELAEQAAMEINNREKSVQVNKEAKKTKPNIITNDELKTLAKTYAKDINEKYKNTLENERRELVELAKQYANDINSKNMNITQDNELGYNIVNLDCRYLDQVSNPTRIKLPSRQRVDNLRINGLNSIEQQKVYRRTI